MKIKARSIKVQEEILRREREVDDVRRHNTKMLARYYEGDNHSPLHNLRCEGCGHVAAIHASSTDALERGERATMDCLQQRTHVIENARMLYERVTAGASTSKRSMEKERLAFSRTQYHDENRKVLHAAQRAGWPNAHAQNAYARIEGKYRCGCGHLAELHRNATSETIAGCFYPHRDPTQQCRCKLSHEQCINAARDDAMAD